MAAATTMATKRDDVPSTPVLSIVTGDDDAVPVSALKYGQTTPGTMARTPKIVSPIGIFSRWTRKGDVGFSSSESDADSASLISTKSRLGIQRPSYWSDDDQSRQSTTSHRIGIERTGYILPEGEIPLSPLNLYLDKNGTSPPPHLIDIEEEGTPSPWSTGRRSFHSSSSDQQLMLDTESQASDDDSVERLVHKQTAEGHYLLNSQPLSSPNEEIRYSLKKGRRGMSSFMRRASEKHLRKPMERVPLKEGIRDMDASFKIFLLLLNPKAKIFELIQLIYSPSSATIGTILEMIPDNSTEPALGAQEYLGLCRPKDGIAIMDTDLMASGSSCKMSCARITRGEILVAIPSGYSSNQIASLSTPILSNQRIVKLLKRSDPLAARRKSSSKRRSSRRSGSSKRSLRNTTVSVVETVKEETSDDLSLEEEVHRAMEHAIKVAAAANAGIPDQDQASRRSSSSAPFVDDDAVRPGSSFDDSFVTSMSMAGETNASDFYTATGMNSSVQSLAYMSDSSTTAGLFSETGVAKRRMRRRSKTRRRDRRSQRNTNAMRVAGAAFAFMVFRYMTDGTVEDDEDDTNNNEESDEQAIVDNPMGILGLTQGLVLLLGLTKLQTYVGQQTSGALPSTGGGL